MAQTTLYLDTARLGRMSPRARQAHLDFARLAGDEGASLPFERFLRFGSDAWPEATRRAFSGLCDWRGVAALKASLRVLASSDAELPVLLAARSAQLMRLAAVLLVQTCRNVLTVDLGWLPYHEALAGKAQAAGRAVTTVALRDAVFDRRADEDEVVAAVCDSAVAHDCDGLFLPAVGHLGVRMPVERIVRTLESAKGLRFVVVDGAQEFSHVSADLRQEFCDLYLAGSHKWLQACHPMGLAFFGRRRSRQAIQTRLERLVRAGEIDDPLLRLSTQLEGDALDGNSETVNLAPLFASQGAVADALEAGETPAARLPARLANLDALARIAPGLGWLPRLVDGRLRTGILLLQAQRQERREQTAEAVRQGFCDRGVALTAYPDGLIRLSMPEVLWQSHQLVHLQDALRNLA